MKKSKKLYLLFTFCLFSRQQINVSLLEHLWAKLTYTRLKFLFQFTYDPLIRQEDVKNFNIGNEDGEEDVVNIESVNHDKELDVVEIDADNGELLLDDDCDEVTIDEHPIIPMG